MHIPAKAHKVNTNALNNWRRLKFGLFIHWGIYSIPAGIWKGEKIPRLGEQIQRHASIDRAEYAALAREFDPVNFQAREIARIAVETGMKYIVFTAKHHDGFCMFKTETTSFNVVDATPSGRDVLKELSEACEEFGLKLGIYFSNPDWHSEKAVSRSPENMYAVFEEFTEEHLELSKSQLTELLTHYGPVCEVFFDMGLPTLEDSIALSAHVHKLQPGCLVSGRVMNNQGDFLTLPDNHLLENRIEEGWETPCTFYHTWGYKSWIERPSAEQQLEKQIHLLSRVTSSGGNYLLNIGPLADGSVHPYERDMLSRIGHWMKRNGAAVLGTESNPFMTRQPWGFASVKGCDLFLHLHNMPENGTIEVKYIKDDPLWMRLCGGDEEIEWERRGDNLFLTVPEFQRNLPVPVVHSRFAGNPVILPPLVNPSEDRILLTAAEEISRGNYNSLQYNTNVPETEKEWSLFIDKPGKYKFSITYTLSGISMPLKIICNSQILRFSLEGETGIDGEGFSDGNEQDQLGRPLRERHFNSGDFYFSESGNYKLYMKKDSSAVTDSGLWTNRDISNNPHRGPWCLNEVWTSHRAAMAKESMAGLEIRFIKLSVNG